MTPPSWMLVLVKKHVIGCMGVKHDKKFGEMDFVVSGTLNWNKFKNIFLFNKLDASEQYWVNSILKYFHTNFIIVIIRLFVCA